MEKETIQKIAHLARLELSEEEQSTMAVEFDKILGWMQQLEELDTTNIEPLLHIHKGTNIFREDIADNKITKTEALFNAPQKNKDYFLVPKVKET